MRVVVIAMLTLALLVPLRAPAAAATHSTLSRELADAIAGFSGSAAVVVVDQRSGYRYAFDEHRVFPSASLYKLGLLVEAERRAAAGTLDLDAEVVT